MIVYKTTNLVNGKIYVGKDVRNDPSYLGSGFLLKQSIEKYGKKNFIKEILEVCSTNAELNEREKYWISTLQSSVRGVGYNIAEGGSGGDTFTRQSPERKKVIRQHLIHAVNTKVKTSKGYKTRGPKISKTKTGVALSPSHCNALSEAHIGQVPWNKGQTFPELSKSRSGSGNPMYGKTISDEHKAAISKAASLRWKKYRESRGMI